MKNRGELRRRRIFLALSLLWMAVIFYFSGQSGSESGALSGSFSEFLGLPEWMLRKGAHMAEYALLGFFLYGFFGACPWKRPWRSSWGTAVLYAASTRCFPPAAPLPSGTCVSTPPEPFSESELCVCSQL